MMVDNLGSSITYPLTGTSQVYYRSGNLFDPSVSFTDWSVDRLYDGNSNTIGI